ncbi:hypothetical protein E2C01_008777 [Portunus trituberculatus]|uniref:Uncharacterized protein n=1 Tax=Portunus trituberculatus TaxID=210409 RepID=A0A5B7D3W2_PORTR|nr:hypothetical protein [Portunus trituberculatus]
MRTPQPLDRVASRSLGRPEAAHPTGGGLSALPAWCKNHLGHCLLYTFLKHFVNPCVAPAEAWRRRDGCSRYLVATLPPPRPAVLWQFLLLLTTSELPEDVARFCPT